MIEGIPIVGLTAPGLLGVAVLLLLLGKIVPRSTLQDKIEEAIQWRKAYEAEREARRLADAQTTELLEVSRTNHALISALFANSERIRRESGAPDADPQE